MRKLLSLFLFIVLFNSIQAQDTSNVYLYKNIKTLSLDSILKMCQLNIDDSAWQIEKYTYIVFRRSCEGNHTTKFGAIMGNKFSEKMIEDIKSEARAELMFQNIVVAKKSNPLLIKKLEGFLVYTYRKR